MQRVFFFAKYCTLSKFVYTVSEFVDRCLKNMSDNNIIISQKCCFMTLIFGIITRKEKYLGHFITDDNSLRESIVADLQDRQANIIIKFRNFINNHRSSPLKIKLRVFQACFCSAILSNCETWEHCMPAKIFSLYNYGLKLALGVRTSTPTSLVYLESQQPYVEALIRKRQLNFWIRLNKGPVENYTHLLIMPAAHHTLSIIKNLRKSLKLLKKPLWKSTGTTSRR